MKSQQHMSCRRGWRSKGPSPSRRPSSRARCPSRRSCRHGDFSELAIHADLLHERQACILQELEVLVHVAVGGAPQVGHRRRETWDVLDAVREDAEEVVVRRRSPECQHEFLPHREEGFQ